MPTVFANGRSILHAGDGGTHIAAPPDVCKTPSPAGPVPIPYVNIAKDGDLAKGTKKVQIEGKSVALESSNLSTSTGDEPGTAGGVISSKNKGKLTWATSSPDVKFEGKAVVRFLDVTQHNGNSFNTAFISAGGTGLAYGDDTACEVCGKDQDAHRVHETDEVASMAAAVELELGELLKPQRPIIAKYMQLREERIQMLDRYQQQIKLLEVKCEPLLQQREVLLRAEKKDGKALGALSKELKPIETEIRTLKADRKKDTAVYDAKLKAEKAKLAGKNVLGEDANTNMFTKGYMLGALVCRCETDAKKLAACSGTATPGFEQAVKNAGFTRVDVFTQTPRQMAAVAKSGRTKWDCAAPKLLQAGGAGGHKVKSMSEKWYSPVVSATVTVTYNKNGKRVTEVFRSGMSVPSCETCQALTPEMLCDNDGECP